MIRKTKIVATIGPASSSKEKLTELIRAGLNVCRINFSHGSHEVHLEAVRNIRAVSDELKIPVAILGDLQGPKLRVGMLPEEGLDLIEGEELCFTTKPNKMGDKQNLYISYSSFAKDVKPGEKILLDDGKLELEAGESDGDARVKAKVIHGGILKSKKGVNLPNTKISLPSLTEKDLVDLEFALEHDFDWIGLSFVRSARDIIELKHKISERNKFSRVVAKIEKPEALKELEGIIDETDAVMVARGDLGVEIPMEEVPLIQKDIIKQCREAAKPVIVATQMMESMIENVTPTRAEVNDVANAVMDGSDAVMLSAETSVGKYPVETVNAMRKILVKTEAFEGIFHHETAPGDFGGDRFISDSICYNACRLAQRVNAIGVVAMTHSGYTAVKLSSQRPKSTVFVFTGNKRLITALSLVWGVECFYYDKYVSTDHTIADIKYILKREGKIKNGDYLINIASMPISEKGTSNMIKLSQVD
ncbi:pyruvate kinase [Luteibaculum oceani]|uniref:Pyruvate kinase n=1 Tax=Luteibaculum oceani TaxID=1294296 RepID=A0A5C6VK79_9FLAO|nr:pyruvate kinase [Luteibaculum oceani]